MHMYYSGRLEAVLKVYFLLLHFLFLFFFIDDWCIVYIFEFGSMWEMYTTLK